MIGRDVELRQLSWAWRTARRGRGQVAVVRGPLGDREDPVALGGGRRRGPWRWGCSVLQPGGGRAGPGRSAQDAGAEDRPVLVAVDDADAGPQAVAEVLAETGSLSGRPVLVVLALDEEHASDEDLRAVRGLTAGIDLVLRPLDPDSVRRVAALYLDSADAVGRRCRRGCWSRPVGCRGGCTRRWRAWAEDRATRRLGVLASQAAGSRSEVAVVESQLAGTVSGPAAGPRAGPAVRPRSGPSRRGTGGVAVQGSGLVRSRGRRGLLRPGTAGGRPGGTGRRRRPGRRGRPVREREVLPGPGRADPRGHRRRAAGQPGLGHRRDASRRAPGPGVERRPAAGAAARGGCCADRHRTAAGPARPARRTARTCWWWWTRPRSCSPVCTDEAERGGVRRRAGRRGRRPGRPDRRGADGPGRLLRPVRRRPAPGVGDRREPGAGRAR